MKPNISDLTLREKIGQTLVFRHNLLLQIPDPEAYFAANPIGATWAMGHSARTYRATQAAIGLTERDGRKDEMHMNYVNLLNRVMRVPVLPVMDASNGIDAKKFEDHAQLARVASVGATADPDIAYRYGSVLGDDLYSIGYRWIWSPVADNAGHFVAAREFGCDTEQNCRMLTAFIHGMQAAGVATGAKHFPGEDPYEYRDSHFCTASYSQSREVWDATQRREFQACIDAGVDSVMISHRTFRAVDDTEVRGALLPATLSYKMITELLKGEMGFEGVVLTDDVDMKGLTAIYPAEKLYVELLRAGNDMILGPHHLNYIDIVERAVLSGELEESRIDDACARVLALKEKLGLFDAPPLTPPSEERRDQIRQNIYALNTEIASRGLTLTANRTGMVPISAERTKRVKVVYIGYSDLCWENLRYMAEEFKRHGAVCEVQRGFTDEDNLTLHEYDLIIYATFIGFHAPVGGQAFYGEECNMMRKIMTVCTERSIGVSFGNPDIFFNYFTAAPTFVNCYSENPETMVGFVKGLYGEISFTDYSPFPLNPIRRNNDVYM